MKCAGCMKSVKELSGIKCTSSTCEKTFCALCSNVSSLSADRKKNWKCPECCASSKKGGDNSLTPIRTGHENVTTRKKTDSTGNELGMLTEQLRSLTQEFSLVKEKLEDLTHSLSHTNERMDDIMSKIVTTNEKIKYLENRDRELENLQATVSLLRNEVNTQAQFNLRNEIEIVGIPESANESLQHIVLVAARKAGVDLEDSDIDWVARVGSKRPQMTTTLPEDRLSTPRPIVVRLLRRSKRDNFLKSSKSRKGMTSSDLEVSGSSMKVFFNERLTKENRFLFRETRLRAKQHGYAFCWCNQGTIYVRQREGKGAIRISSHQELDRVLPVSVEAAASKSTE
ncbi:uncharacterized protein LOC106136907 [Amyelois transitella]|uniref:uncharacterized protein LOC106136907 n=1 Tax=Amyelois transitella TaxID=680683 RepID=UPI00067CACA3|nr:uncharacterized protein LOC106136907 [Amyelois transitella]